MPVAAAPPVVIKMSVSAVCSNATPPIAPSLCIEITPALAAAVAVIYLSASALSPTARVTPDPKASLCIATS